MPTFSNPPTLVPQNVDQRTYGGPLTTMSLDMLQTGVVNSITEYDLTAYIKNLIQANDPTQGLMFINANVLQGPGGHPLKRY